MSNQSKKDNFVMLQTKAKLNYLPHEIEYIVGRQSANNEFKYNKLVAQFCGVFLPLELSHC